MGSKLPFVGRLFWVILPGVYLLAFLVFFILIKFFDYQLTNADIGGSLISGFILSYLLHLWMLPGEHAHSGDQRDIEDQGATEEETQPEDE